MVPRPTSKLNFWIFFNFILIYQYPVKFIHFKVILNLKKWMVKIFHNNQVKYIYVHIFADDIDVDIGEPSLPDLPSLPQSPPKTTTTKPSKPAFYRNRKSFETLSKNTHKRTFLYHKMNKSKREMCPRLYETLVKQTAEMLHNFLEQHPNHHVLKKLNEECVNNDRITEYNCDKCCQNSHNSNSSNHYNNGNSSNYNHHNHRNISHYNHSNNNTNSQSSKDDTRHQTYNTQQNDDFKMLHKRCKDCICHNNNNSTNVDNNNSNSTEVKESYHDHDKKRGNKML